MLARLRAQLFLQSLRQTERLSSNQLVQFVGPLLRHLLENALRSPFWQRRLAPLRESGGGLSLAGWHDVALLSAADAISAGGALRIEPDEATEVADAGEAAGPFRHRDELARFADLCQFERVVEMHGVALNATLADLLDLGLLVPNEWPWSSTFGKAQRVAIPKEWPADFQLDAISRRGAKLLRASPRTLAALATELEERDAPAPPIIAVIAVGEPLDDHLRKRLVEAFGTPVISIWHDPRLGVLAFDDPSASGWRIAAATQFLEVVEANGTPCPIGRPGFIATTTLYNNVTPAIRFVPGHQAEFLIGPEGAPRLRSLISPVS